MTSGQTVGPLDGGAILTSTNFCKKIKISRKRMSFMKSKNQINISTTKFLST